MSTLRKKPLRCRSCQLDQNVLERIGRSPFLRLIPFTRLYQCWACSDRYVKFLGFLFKA